MPKKRCPNCKSYNYDKDALNIKGRSYCDMNCAVSYASKNKDKGKQIKHREQKRNFKANDKRLRRESAQSAFNAFVRERDKNLPCISCGRTDEDVKSTDGWKTGGAWDCGHYLTRGAFPELRFEELNAHKQCKSCNGGSDKYAKKTQLVKDDYRINLIKKIGIEKVEWIEGPHEIKKYSCDDLKEIEIKYKNKLKEIKCE